MKENGHEKEVELKEIRLIDKAFLVLIVIVFFIGIIIIGAELIDNASKKNNRDSVSSNKPSIRWEYTTTKIEHKKAYDFSDMLDDGWQMVGMQIEKDEIYLTFRKATNQ